MPAEPRVRLARRFELPAPYSCRNPIAPLASARWGSARVRGSRRCSDLPFGSGLTPVVPSGVSHGGVHGAALTDFRIAANGMDDAQEHGALGQIQRPAAEAR